MTSACNLNIEGLDDKMEGGIPDKHIVLLAGTPGTMKSTLAYYILNTNQDEHKGLYLTLEQDKDNFLYHIKKMGMGEPAEGKLNLYDLTTTREQWQQLSQQQAAPADTADRSTNMELETFKRQIETLKNALGFDLLVIDSLPVTEMMFRMKDPRDELFHFFRWLKKLGVTTFLITEMSQDSPKYSKHDVDFLADGIIKLEMAQVNPTKMQRRIQVVKMRGVNHTTDPYELRYSGDRFEALKVIV